MFYLNLFRALQREEVRYLVAGGLAVDLYGVQRATMDVGLMLAFDSALERARRLVDDGED